MSQIPSRSDDIPDLFERSSLDAVVTRVRLLNADQRPEWGQMNAGEMLAHCRVAFAMALRDDFPRPNRLLRLLYRFAIKPQVTGRTPYRRNLPTALIFKVGPQQDFVRERDGLIADLQQVYRLGPSYLDGRESPTLGPLSATEWNVMLAKHIDHHLTQFGV
ncbi:MAG: DUF1569 domain-containing protein [Gemmatimonadetes bacterium]|jgi:hypothetical protein|nr:DUF1569 domain-containing protein [Gemmatimonadota bacterium]